MEEEKVVKGQNKNVKTSMQFWGNDGGDGGTGSDTVHQEVGKRTNAKTKGGVYSVKKNNIRTI